MLEPDAVADEPMPRARLMLLGLPDIPAAKPSSGEAIVCDVLDSYGLLVELLRCYAELQAGPQFARRGSEPAPVSQSDGITRSAVREGSCTRADGRQVASKGASGSRASVGMTQWKA